MGSVTDLAEELLRQSWQVQAALATQPVEFRLGHRQYMRELRERVRSVVLAEGRDTLAKLGLDWLTLHYKSVHPIEDWESESPWLQAAVPLTPFLASGPGDQPRPELSVYEGAVSRYIEAFRRSQVEAGEPVHFLLHDDARSQALDDGSWLPVGRQLADLLRDFTRGPVGQGDLSFEEAQLCREADPQGVDRVRQYLTRWYSGKDPLADAQALGLLRDSCRVTFLALKLGIPEVKLPRAVILVPVYVGDNLIGGAAFIGTRLLERLPALLLSSFAVTLLSALRLREDPEREGAIHEIEELNRAREEFVQRVTHSVQNPVEAVQLSVRKADSLLDALREEFKGVVSEVDKLRASADGIMTAFSERDPDRFLKPKKLAFGLWDFLDTQVFVQTAAYRERGIDLQLEPFPADWQVEADKDMLAEALENLLRNALRFARKRVVIAAGRMAERDLAVVRVRDDGPGVDPAIRERLFQPEVRGGEARGPSHGLGLHLARKHMRRQGGEVRLVDRPAGEGAEFLMEIPLASRQGGQ